MLKLRKLEQRIVLDAAGVVEVVEQEAQHLAAQVGIGAEELLNGVAAFMLAENNSPTRQSFDVVLISNALDDYGQLVNSVKDGAHIVVYDAASDDSEEILAKVSELAKSEGREVDSITLLSHGEAGKFMLGKDSVDHEFLEKHKRAFASLGDVMSNDADWFIYSCDVLDKSANGQQLLSDLAQVTGASVFASDDLTGSGGDWVLEGFSGDSFAEQARNGVLDIAALEQNYTGTLEIQTNGSTENATVNVTLNEGGFLAISSDDHLSSTSDRPEVSPEDIVYTVLREPEHGRIVLFSMEGDGGVRAQGDTFTQADIDAGRVFYQHDGEPGTEADSVYFSITDGYPQSVNRAEINFTIIDTNDKPVVDFYVGQAPEFDATGTQVTFTEGDDPVVLATGDGVTITDEEGHRIRSATIFFQGYHNEIETLQVDLGEHEGQLLWDYDPSTGILLIHGVADAEVYEEVLATLSYHSVVDGHAEDDPNQRVVRITVTDNDQENPRTSERVSVLIDINPVNDAPVVDTDNTSQAHTATFIEDQAPVAIFDEQFTLYDVDDTHLSQAQIIINATPDGDDEYLTVDIDAINAERGTDLVAQYNSFTGVLTIAGDATIEDYQAVLATVCYHNDSQNPTEETRSVTVRVRDGEVYSELAETRIDVQAVNDAPVIEVADKDGSDEIVEAFTEGDDPLAVLEGRLDINDVDDTVITSAQIEITNRPDGDDEEYLLTDLGAGISITYEDGRILLTGEASADDYAALLSTLTYQNQSDDPSDEDRRLLITVTDGSDQSQAIEATIQVNPVDDATVIDIAENGEPYRGQYVENESAVAIVPDSVSITDPDSDTIDGLRITVTNLEDGALEVLEATVLPFGIQAEYAGGVLTLTGTESLEAYEQILLGVSYQVDGEQPTAGERVISIEVLNDGTYGDPVSTIIEVVPVNDAPVIDSDPDSSDETQVGYRVTYHEGDDPVLVVDQDAQINDIDSDTLTSLVVRIENLQDIGDELLTADVTGTGLDADYDPDTGTLTITGAASEDTYAAVMATIAYSNTSDNPDAAERQVTLQTHDGESASNVTYTTIRVVGDNDPAVIGHDATDPGQVYEVTFTEDQGAVVAVNEAFFISDVDSDTVESATITLVNLPDGAQELLSIPYDGDQFDIAYGNGVLVITGSGTAAEYAELITELRYENLSQDPNTMDRRIEIVVNDGESNSDPIASIVHVVPVNDAPVIENDPSDVPGDGKDRYSVTFDEGDDPVLLVADDAIISDIDNDTLVSARIELDELFDLDQELLNATGTDNIDVFFDAESRILRLQGEASIEEYQDVIRSLSYENTSEDPTEGTRTVTIRVFDGQAESTLVETTIEVNSINDAPVANVVPENGSEEIRERFVEGGEPLALLEDRLELVDVDDAEIVSAVINIENRPDGVDEQYVLNTEGTGITVVYHDDRIELTGAATPEVYETVLESLTYQNLSEDPSDEDRVLSIVLSDGSDDSIAVQAVIEVEPVDDEAVLDISDNGETFRNDYIENSDGVSVVPDTLTIADPDSDTLDGVRVAIVNVSDNEEQLTIDNLPEGLNATFENGVLEITGTASIQEYQQVLQDIRFSIDSENPTEGERNITVQLLNNGVYGDAGQSIIDVTAVNDAPVIDTDPDSDDGNEIGYQVSYTENDDPIAILDEDFELSDVDSQQLTNVVVTIANVKDGDQLHYQLDPNGSITADYNVAEGRLTFSGDASAEEYQTVLATLQYSNSSEDPDGEARQIVLQTSDGEALSNLSYTTVEVTPVNDPTEVGHDPAQPGVAYTAVFTEDEAAVAVVADTFYVNDPDNTVLVSATLTLAEVPNGTDETLALDYQGDQFVISYSDGVMTITGDGTAEEYQALIRDVVYSNSTQDPDGSDRQLTITVNDGNGEGQAAVTTIEVQPVNDAPEVFIDPENNSGDGPQNYRGIWVEDGGPAPAVDEALQLVDVDNDVLQGARIALDDFPDGTAEMLAVTTISDNIDVEYRADVGLLILSGEATLGEYEQVLRSLTYDNTSQAPTDEERVVTISVFDGEDYSAISQSTIEIIDEKDDPNVDLDGQGLGTDYENTFIEDGGPVAASNDVRITDVDSPSLSQAVIEINNIQEDGQEFIAVVIPAEYPQLTVDYDAATGRLTVTGEAPIEAYEQVLSSLTYENTSDDPTEIDRFISVTVTDVGDEPTTSDIATTTIHVEAINDSPILVPPEDPLVASPGQEVPVLPSFLSTVDPDSPPSEVIYQLPGTGLETGEFLLNGEALEPGGTFTQEDINNGNVSFVANEDAENTEESFLLDVYNPENEEDKNTFTFGVVVPGNIIDVTNGSDPSDRLFGHDEHGPFTSSDYPDAYARGLGHTSASAIVRDASTPDVGSGLDEVRVDGDDLLTDNGPSRYDDAIERIQRQADELGRSLEALEGESSLDLPTGTAGVFAADGIGGGRDLVQTCSELAILDDGCRIVPSDDLNERIDTAQPEQVGLTDSGELNTNGNTAASLTAAGGVMLSDAEACETLSEPPKVFADDFAAAAVDETCAADSLEASAEAPIDSVAPERVEFISEPQIPVVDIPLDQSAINSAESPAGSDMVVPNSADASQAEPTGGKVRQLVDKVLDRIR